MKKSTRDAYRERILSVLVVKMTRQFAGLQDYVVSKLEARRWLDGDSHNFANVPPEQWNRRLRIRGRNRGELC